MTKVIFTLTGIVLASSFTSVALVALVQFPKHYAREARFQAKLEEHRARQADAKLCAAFLPWFIEHGESPEAYPGICPPAVLRAAKNRAPSNFPKRQREKSPQ